MDALTDLLARIGAADGGAVQINELELNQWTPDAVAAMKAAKLLTKTHAASSAICPGCERECVMPVHVLAPAGAPPRAFVICDKRSDINRVSVPKDRLEQWRASGDAVADLLAHLLELQRGVGGESGVGRWEVGTLRGSRNSSHVVMRADGELKLSVAGHLIAVADVLELKGGGFTVHRPALLRMVNQPAAGGGDIKSAALRRERLAKRVREEQAKGTRGFLKIVAAEERISPTRLKQILQKDPVGMDNSAEGASKPKKIKR